MTPVDDWLATNRANWDERAAPHAASPDYAVERFRSDPTFISDVVRFDVPRLGDLAGLRGVHLQCHIGTDTLSLSRLGATMTGLDFSPAALEQARALCDHTGEEVEFVESAVYDALDVLPAGAFDLVFTGIGALCWLPDIRRWGQIVAALLRPGGRLFLREGHPMLWASDERPDGSVVLDFPYFEQPEPLVWNEGGTYVETDHVFQTTVSVEWNHGLGEIVTALLDEGLTITQLVEHDTIPWNGLPALMEPVGDGEYALRERRWRLPMSYTLQAVKA
jgi:SAM-dependent methyltransferase